MQIGSIKAVLATSWVLVVCLAGIAGNLNSISSWTFLSAVALFPPIVMMWQWNRRPQTMSESIQEVTR